MSTNPKPPTSQHYQLAFPAPSQRATHQSPRPPPPPPLPPIPPRRTAQIINIQQINALLNKHLPDIIPQANRPKWEIPVARLEAAAVRAADLAAQEGELVLAEFAGGEVADCGAEFGGGVVGVLGGVGVGWG